MKTDILYVGRQQELLCLYLSEGSNLVCDKCCEDIWSILSIGYSEVLQVYVNAFGKKDTVPEAPFYRHVSLFITVLMWFSENMDRL